MSQARTFRTVSPMRTKGSAVANGQGATGKGNGSPAKASSPTPPSSRPASPLDSLVKFFTSLRLTVVCLALGMGLVFAGTLAQVDLGLYKAQNEFFRSFFVYWGPKGASWRIPVFPGGYLIGGVLLISFVLLRSAFLGSIENPEPRYVLECFPALLALAAGAFTQFVSSAQTLPQSTLQK